MKIVLDIYGGDNSPYAPIDGAVDFIRCKDDVTVILSGDENTIRSYLDSKGIHEKRLEILHAPDEITCHDEPTSVVRKKPESSMVRAVKCVADGEAQGVVSSGSTGALYAASLSRIKRIHGITRPALTPELPTVHGGHALLADCGANADCIPEFLTQFALMGTAYMRAIYGIESPRIALLSNGTEEEKGNALTREAHLLLKNMNLNFTGNAEAREIFSGDADVYVCDGFTGNILLKTIEGTAKAMTTLLKAELMSSFKSKMGGLLIKTKMSNFKKKFDYREIGGSPLLGINGCVIKAHGSSDAKAYKNALEQAYTFIARDVKGEICRELEKLN
ncbi:MAG: phosphate acyltransferase PlsX [Clostridia bacterium]|nr:phosphate acyltransferase PlsX [Clostridia bacterium]